MHAPLSFDKNEAVTRVGGITKDVTLRRLHLLLAMESFIHSFIHPNPFREILAHSAKFFDWKTCLTQAG
jgi:hypothetical protein